MGICNMSFVIPCCIKWHQKSGHNESVDFEHQTHVPATRAWYERTTTHVRNISDMEQLLQGSKSDLMECLTNCSQSASIHPGMDAKVLDRAAIVHMVRPGASRTFKENIPSKCFFRISPLSVKLSS